MNKKSILITGTLLAGLGVALGAIGSHAWKNWLLETGRTETFETAVRYHIYNAFALLVIGLLFGNEKGKLPWAAWAFIGGVLCFSGSLYALSLTSLKWVVYVTPIGGVLMLAGWALLTIHVMKMKQ